MGPASCFEGPFADYSNGLPKMEFVTVALLPKMPTCSSLTICYFLGLPFPVRLARMSERKAWGNEPYHDWPDMRTPTATGSSGSSRCGQRPR
jgi:hypothetical protein